MFMFDDKDKSLLETENKILDFLKQKHVNKKSKIYGLST